MIVPHFIDVAVYPCDGLEFVAQRSAAVVPNCGALRRSPMPF
jgi:hypothetical protein